VGGAGGVAEVIPSSLYAPEDPDALVPTRMRFRVSVSQIKMFHPGAGGCPRKWALHYLAKVPRLPNLALTDGIRLHECIQQYLTLTPDEWARRWPSYWQPGMTSEQTARVKTARLALAMAPHVPDGRMPPVVEPTEFLEVPELDTAIYIKPDLTRDRRWFVDWKSTSATNRRSEWCLQQPEFWANGPDALSWDQLEPSTLESFAARGIRWLADDIQARVYAHGLMQQWREVKVTARWVYGSKKFAVTDQPKTWIVEHTFERAETRAWVEKNVWPTIDTMNTIRAAYEQGRLDSPLLVPHAPASCEGIGKFCDALGPCGFQPSPVPLSRLRLPVLPGSSLP
jgi:hypothetical protein